MDRIDNITEQIRQNPKLVVSDDFEFAVFERESAVRRFANGILQDSKNINQIWITLRILQRKSPGASSISGDSKEAIQQLIQSACQSSEASNVDPWARFPIWRAQAIQHKSQLDDLSPEEIEASLRSRYDGLSRKPYGLLEDHQVETERVTLLRKLEKGVLRSERRSQQSSFNVSLAQDDGWFLEERNAIRWAPNQQNEILAELIGTASQMTGAKTISEDVPTRFVLGSRVTAYLLQMSEGKFLAASGGTVGFGDQPLSEALTLIDDGSLTGLPQSAVFDMEGALTERTIVIEGGLLRSLLHSTQTATKENRLSTGNFVLRSGTRHPTLGFTNFFIEKGPTTDVISELGDGLFLERIESVERKSDGSLGLSLRGYTVRGGRLMEPVRRVILNYSLTALLRDAKKVGQDLEFFGNVGSPSILFEKIP